MLVKDLKYFRKQRKLSQEQVAKLIGVSRSTYSGYELGYFSPPIDKAIKLKKLFNIDDDRIFLNCNVLKKDKNKSQHTTPC